MAGGQMHHELTSDRSIIQLHGDTVLNRVRPDILYAVFDPSSGQKLITTTYALDVLPLLTQRGADSDVRWWAAETLAHAVVFILARGDFSRLGRLGFEWVNKRSTLGPFFKSPNNPSSPERRTTPRRIAARLAQPPPTTPRRKAPPDCSKCCQPMKGHSKLNCDEMIGASSLENSAANLFPGDHAVDWESSSANIHCGRDSNLGTSEGRAECLVFSLKDIADLEVRATAARAQGLMSEAVSFPGAKSDEVAYIIGDSRKSMDTLAKEVATNPSDSPARSSTSWSRLSYFAALGAITTWASLAYM
ncbi:hypothetical protein LXA43DRAFT_1063704 [Ganoderma leucocontextum]|nr:hypothetical protein LXA43DRAFT_1063704 [Ganoderma leucocontextum]